MKLVFNYLEEHFGKKILYWSLIFLLSKFEEKALPLNSEFFMLVSQNCFLPSQKINLGEQSIWKPIQFETVFKLWANFFPLGCQDCIIRVQRNKRGEANFQADGLTVLFSVFWVKLLPSLCLKTSRWVAGVRSTCASEHFGVQLFLKNLKLLVFLNGCESL